MAKWLTSQGREGLISTWRNLQEDTDPGGETGSGGDVDMVKTTEEGPTEGSREGGDRSGSEEERKQDAALVKEVAALKLQRIEGGGVRLHLKQIATGWRGGLNTGARLIDDQAWATPAEAISKWIDGFGCMLKEESRLLLRKAALGKEEEGKPDVTDKEAPKDVEEASRTSEHQKAEAVGLDILADHLVEWEEGPPLGPTLRLVWSPSKTVWYEWDQQEEGLRSEKGIGETPPLKKALLDWLGVNDRRLKGDKEEAWRGIQQGSDAE